MPLDRAKTDSQARIHSPRDAGPGGDRDGALRARPESERDGGAWTTSSAFFFFFFFAAVFFFPLGAALALSALALAPLAPCDSHRGKERGVLRPPGRGTYRGIARASREAGSNAMTRTDFFFFPLFSSSRDFFFSFEVLSGLISSPRTLFSLLPLFLFLSPFLPFFFERARRKRERADDLAAPRAPAAGSPPGSLDAAPSGRELARRRRRRRDGECRRRPFSVVDVDVVDDDCTELALSRRVRSAGPSAMVSETVMPCFLSRKNPGEWMLQLLLRRAVFVAIERKKKKKRQTLDQEKKNLHLLSRFSASPSPPPSAARTHRLSLFLNHTHPSKQTKKTAPRRSRAAPPAIGATSSRRCSESSSAAARRRGPGRSS